MAALDGSEPKPLGLTQPTVSHHLKILVDAEIFTDDKRGVWTYYALRPQAFQVLAAILGDTSPPGGTADH